MAWPSVTVDIDCNLSVSRDTAEACLKLVELYLNSSKCMLITARDESGKVKLCLASEEEWLKNDDETD